MGQNLLGTHEEENEEYLEAAQNGDLVEVADALGDMLYILCGTILTHGMQHVIQKVFLFGSYARGEQKPGSDIDMLVRFDQGATLFDLVGLGDFLEELLRLKVDIVSERALRIEIRDRILAEVVEV